MPYLHFRNEATRSSVLSALHDTADQAAWGRFFDTYAGFIYGIARHEGLGEADADDIVQTVMTELVRGGAATRYDKTRGPFRGWLSQLTLWRVRSLMRQESRRDRAQSFCLFKKIFPDTHLCVDLKLITHQQGRMPVGAYLDGFITRSGEDKFIFTEKARKGSNDCSFSFFCATPLYI